MSPQVTLTASQLKQSASPFYIWSNSFLSFPFLQVFGHLAAFSNFQLKPPKFKAFLLVELRLGLDQVRSSLLSIYRLANRLADRLADRLTDLCQPHTPAGDQVATFDPVVGRRSPSVANRPKPSISIVLHFEFQSSKSEQILFQKNVYNVAHRTRSKRRKTT